MRIITSLFASITLIAVSAPALAASRDRSPQAKLARALEGRVAGKPVSCILLRDIRSSQIIDRTAILYETSGGKLYVNYPDSGATFLSWGDILVTDTHSSQLCDIDIVRLVDQGSRMPSGSVGLGKFIPYTKASAKHR